MKISQRTRFPYPVLSNSSNDYLKGHFAIVIDIKENLTTGALNIKYDVNLTEPEILKSVKNGKASIFFFVTCFNTYYNNIHEVGLTPSNFELEKGTLSGTVKLFPFIATIDSLQIESENLHEDYGSTLFDFNKAEILSIGDEYRINVGREKLAPVESIFNLAVDDNVPVDEFRLQPDSEKLTIVAERGTYELMVAFRNSAIGRSALLNGVYLPAVMEVLSILSQDVATYQERSWFKVFEAKCIHHNINIQNLELLEASQKLLGAPFQEVISSIEASY